jgi:phosphate transport system substrate-binding protein
MTSFPSNRFLKSVMGIAVIAATLLIAACGSTSGGSSSTSNSLTACKATVADLTIGAGGTSTATKTGDYGGKTFNIDGSTALQPLVAAAAKTFNSVNNVTINVGVGGSTTGLTHVDQGSTAVGMSDIFPADSSKTSSITDLTDHRVAVVAFTLIVSDDIKDKVQNLTTQQIKDIFTGKDTNWSDLNGPTEAINVINRTAGSGTRVTFEKYVLGTSDYTNPNATVQDSSGAAVQAVKSGQGAISYVSTGFVIDPANAGANPICIDGSAASVTNINSGKYKFWGYEHMYTKGTVDPAIQAFIDFIGNPSSDFQKMDLPRLGFITVGDLTQAAKDTHPLPAGSQ